MSEGTVCFSLNKTVPAENVQLQVITCAVMHIVQLVRFFLMRVRLRLHKMMLNLCHANVNAPQRYWSLGHKESETCFFLDVIVIGVALFSFRPITGGLQGNSRIHKKKNTKMLLQRKSRDRRRIHSAAVISILFHRGELSYKICPTLRTPWFLSTNVLFMYLKAQLMTQKAK